MNKIISQWEIRQQLLELKAENWLGHWTGVSFCFGTLQQCEPTERYIVKWLGLNSQLRTGTYGAVVKDVGF